MLRRRDFVTILGSGAALGLRGRAQSAADRFRPEFARHAPYQALSRYILPGNDEFASEVRHDRIAAHFARLGETRRLPLAPGFRAASPLPVEKREIRREGGLRLVEGRFSSDFSQSAEAFERDLRELLTPRGTWRVAEFHIVSISDSGDVTVRYELADAGRVRQGRWRQRWEERAGVVELARSATLDEVACEVEGPLFEDMTGLWAGRCPEQLLRGINHWRARLDAATGIDVYGNNGVAAGDIDNDGRDEIYVCQPAGLPNRLLARGRDRVFEDIAGRAGVDVLDETASALFVDLDNDGWQDLVVVRAAGPLLFANQRDGTFRLVPDAFRFVQKPQGAFTGAAAADYDGDGLVDLYFCCYIYFQGEEQYRYPVPYHDAQNGPPNFLFHNEGGLAFRDVTAESGMSQNNNRYSFAAAWCDYDGDGRPDLYVANDFGRNNLYRNLGGGKFRDVAREAGVEDIGPGMSVSWLDYDNDGRPDLYVSNMWAPAGLRLVEQREFQPNASQEVREMYRRHARGNSLYHNRGDGTFVEVRGEAEMGRWAWASEGCDFNNDGYPEIYVAAGMMTNGPAEGSGDASRPDLMGFFWRQVVARSPLDARPSPAYENGWNALNQWIREDYSWNGGERNVFYLNHRGHFYDVSGVSGLDIAADSRAFAITDLDGDGNLDLVVKNRGTPQIRFFRNHLGVGRHSIAFQLQGTASNRDGIGARVEVVAGGLRQVKFVQAGSAYLSQHTKTLYFGLGGACQAAEVNVRWPSGREQSFRDLAAGRRYFVEEGASDLRSEAFLPREGRPVNPLAIPPERPASAVWLAAPLHLPRSLNLEKFTGFVYVHSESDPEEPELKRLALPVRAMALTGQATAVFGVLWRYLFDLRTELPARVLFLLDRGAAVRVYWREWKADELRKDLARLPLDRAAQARLAVPFGGALYRGSFERNYHRYGAAFYWAGQPEAALEYFTLAAAQHPEAARTQYALGRLYMELKRPQEAQAALERALKLNPAVPEAWNDLGGLALERGDLTAGIEYFQRALEIHPDLPYVLLNLGQAWARAGRPVEAERAFRRILALEPREPEAANQLGLLLAKQDRIAEARSLFQRAIEARPDYAEAINNIGVLYVNTGALNDAIAAFQYGIRVAPDFELCYLNLARLYAGQGNISRAREVLEQLLQRKPGNELARRALEQLGR